MVKVAKINPTSIRRLLDYVSEHPRVRISELADVLELKIPEVLDIVRFLEWVGILKTDLCGSELCVELK